MEQEKIDLIIRAVQVLQGKKEIYDYLIVILPVVTGLGGWFASIWWQSRTFCKNTRKEHYYQAKEKVESFVEKFNMFLQFVYTFYKNVKNRANLGQPPLGVDVLADFVTEYQFQLATIHQKLRITFPGRSFPIKVISDRMKDFEAGIAKIDNVIIASLDPESDEKELAKQVETISTDNNDTMSKITGEITNIENTIIGILNKMAGELGIKDLG
ncbi:MAG: hypothetical protein JW720_11065 [Sedimentisphaerales bacterium]|nr:hypothetical protein [Sedimentisphaerales bacterium]